MEREEKIEMIKLIVAAVLFVLSYLPLFGGTAGLVLVIAAYIIAGFDVLKEAVENIFHGELFDENFLMALATVGAFAIGEYPEAAAVMILYGIGELFQDLAVERSHDSVVKLMDLRPDWANVDRNGKVERVKPEDVAVGEVIEVRPGERIPLDGTVIEGVSGLNTAALTGESLPRDVEAGDEVSSGCVNLTGLLRIKVRSGFAESTVSKILKLVEQSEENKAETERFITRFARVYTPVVVIAAAILALAPSIITGNWAEWVHRALIFLVISCPCALVISIPLGFFGGIGGASKCGILFKGGNYLEAMAKLDTVVFDKTGTLTEGSFAVTSVYSEEVTEEELLDIAAHAECYSDHPISQSIREAAGMPDRSRVGETEELPGHGVKTVVDGRTVLAGNSRLMESHGIKWKPCVDVGTVVHVAADGKYLGHIVISDRLKPGAREAVLRLRAVGVKKIVMLTGDRAAVGEAVAAELMIDEVHTELLPAEKVAEVQRLMKEKEGTLAFVGDGINDAPVLKCSDVGIAMGAMGSDAAIEASDVVLMDDAPTKIAKGIRIARHTMRIVRENVVIALGIKAAVMILGALGYANMWAAVFADVGTAFIAILNSLRAMRTEKL